jgi:hypothetical protein
VKEDDIYYAFVEGDDWVYNQPRNSVIFNEYVPSPLAEVYVTYDLLKFEE